MRIYNSSLFLLKQFEKLVPEKIKDHSLAVAKRCHQLALREKASSEVLFFAGLFHDIGKSSSLKKAVSILSTELIT